MGLLSKPQVRRRRLAMMVSAAATVSLLVSYT